MVEGMQRDVGRIHSIKHVVTSMQTEMRKIMKDQLADIMSELETISVSIGTGDRDGTETAAQSESLPQMDFSNDEEKTPKAPVYRLSDRQRRRRRQQVQQEQVRAAEAPEAPPGLDYKMTGDELQALTETLEFVNQAKDNGRGAEEIPKKLAKMQKQLEIEF